MVANGCDLAFLPIRAPTTSTDIAGFDRFISVIGGVEKVYDLVLGQYRIGFFDQLLFGANLLSSASRGWS
jgi:hypothetical protein